MKRKAKIFYAAMDDFWRKEEKLAWLRENPISKIAFESITPDEKHNWINQTDNDWDDLIPVGEKDVKLSKLKEGAIFELFSLGVATNRDDWNYDFDENNQKAKAKFFCKYYEESKKKFRQLKDKTEFADTTIKFTSEILDHFNRDSSLTFDPAKTARSSYRPFSKRWTYFDKIITHRPYQNILIFGQRVSGDNTVIAFNVNGDDFRILASINICDLHFIGDSQCLPLYRYDPDGNRHDNITDWAVEEFARRGARGVSKEDIFHYVYAVLHYPPYRQKYEQNLKREFPRIPVYSMVPYWADLGQMLMELHLNYETVEPYPLVRKEIEPLLRYTNAGAGNKNPVAIAPGSDLNARGFIPKPTTKLRGNKEAGVIEIDSQTRLEGVPAIAWEYKLGNRSALEWILDQYKERKPKDPTIAEKFNTYRFADYKEHVIDLLKRVCTVSVKTMEIINSMPDE